MRPISWTITFNRMLKLSWYLFTEVASPQRLPAFSLSPNPWPTARRLRPLPLPLILGCAADNHIVPQAELLFSDPHLQKRLILLGHGRDAAALKVTHAACSSSSRILKPSCCNRLHHNCPAVVLVLLCFNRRMIQALGLCLRHQFLRRSMGDLVSCLHALRTMLRMQTTCASKAGKGGPLSGGGIDS